MLQQRDSRFSSFVGCDIKNLFKPFWGISFTFYRGVDDAQDQDGGTDVERVNSPNGYRLLLRRIADADKRR